VAHTTGRFGAVPEETLMPQVQVNLQKLPHNACRSTVAAAFNAAKVGVAHSLPSFALRSASDPGGLLAEAPTYATVLRSRQ
jgi:hypothetical protein